MAEIRDRVLSVIRTSDEQKRPDASSDRLQHLTFDRGEYELGEEELMLLSYGCAVRLRLAIMLQVNSK